MTHFILLSLPIFAAVALDWVAVKMRFMPPGGTETLAAPMPAVSVSDDEFGTVPAVQRLLSCFTSSTRTLIEITPASIGERSIGHFGFFNSRYEKTLWPLAIQWLRCGRVLRIMRAR